ncbi:MAG: DNA gyrase inhibitor YacG [Pseudomonadota bacterium]
MAKCPICGAPTVHKWRPFCSKRCADVDLGKWMTGGYALPSEEPVDPDELEREIERETRRGEND